MISNRNYRENYATKIEKKIYKAYNLVSHFHVSFSLDLPMTLNELESKIKYKNENKATKIPNSTENSKKKVS